MTDWCDGCGIKTIVYPVNPHGETIYCCEKCIDEEGWIIIT